MSSEEVPWYKSALTAYNNNTKSAVIVADYIIQHSGQIGLDRCRSCISIGAGTGDSDIPLLKNCLPNLKRYIAVDPNENELDIFRQRLSATENENLKTSLVPQKVEDWKGPGEPVDTVFLIQMLYYVPDRRTLMKRCFDWLNPGGILLVVHDRGHNSFTAAAEKFNVECEKYTSSNARQDLLSLGIHINEQQIETEFDIRDRDKDLMNFIRQKELTEQEFDELDAFLTEYMPSGRERHYPWIAWSHKN